MLIENFLETMVEVEENLSYLLGQIHVKADQYMEYSILVDEIGDLIESYKNCKDDIAKIKLEQNFVSKFGKYI
jgi:hypothetical protein